MAGLGSVGAGSAVFGAIGQHAQGAHPWAPGRSYLRALQGYQTSDEARLHSADPFSGGGLGFTPGEMQAKIGGGVDQAQSEYASNMSDIEHQAALRGPEAGASGAFYRNRQRAAGDLLARSAEVRRQNVLANAMQSRQDLYNRMGLTQGLLSGSANLYNAVENEKAARRQAPYAAAGKVGDTALAAYGGGII